MYSRIVGKLGWKFRSQCVCHGRAGRRWTFERECFAKFGCAKGVPAIGRHHWPAPTEFDVSQLSAKGYDNVVYKSRNHKRHRWTCRRANVQIHINNGVEVLDADWKLRFLVDERHQANVKRSNDQFPRRQWPPGTRRREQRRVWRTAFGVLWRCSCPTMFYARRFLAHDSIWFQHKQLTCCRVCDRQDI